MEFSSSLNTACCILACAAVLSVASACKSSRSHLVQKQPFILEQPTKTATSGPQGESGRVHLTSHLQAEPVPVPPSNAVSSPERLPSTVPLAETLEDLEASAAVNNPVLRRLEQEAIAEWAKTGYVAKLPDPSISTMVFMPPMHFDPDRQVAELQVSQMIPWLGRLNAEAREAYFEALAAVSLYQAERLKVIADLRENWFKLYVLGKQIATTETDKEQLQSLIKTANARVATGDAQPGDVLMASLELSALQEQLISYRQQVVTTTAEINRLVGRDSRLPISPPATLVLNLPEWNRDGLRAVAREKQPELLAARLQTAARAWGIEVARLKRRPDLTLGAGWMAMDAPGATMPGAGGDSFTLGVMANIPMWQGKYAAMTVQATREHAAAQATEDEVALRIDALLSGLWEQAQANQQIVQLYETSILPQARQTFEADQQSLVNNTVTFDRVIRDYRTLLNLELGYHRALGQLAISLARIRQTVGTDSPELALPAWQ